MDKVRRQSVKSQVLVRLQGKHTEVTATQNTIVFIYLFIYLFIAQVQLSPFKYSHFVLGNS